MAIKAEILADSISPAGVRLTTLLCEYPRFIHSELMTHRVFSRNAASSRAIPPEKQIQRIIDDPFVPVFGSRVAGMGEGELDDLSQDAARRTWLLARDSAVDYAKVLNKLGTDKSRINRLLEPFSWITVIITATEWSNFFALRDHPAAQGEFQQLARAMREAMDVHTPRELRHGQWHLPLVKIGGRTTDWEVAKKLCVSRCARVSYDKQHDEEPLEKSLERYDRLLESGHFSPFEHAARPVFGNEGFMMMIGNFRGWFQHRYEIPHQEDYGKMLEDHR